MATKHAPAAAQPDAVTRKIERYKRLHYDKAIEDNLPVEDKHSEGALIPFILNEAQRGLHLLWEAIRLRNLKMSAAYAKIDPTAKISDGPINIIVVKERQGGVSSYCQARFLIHAMWTDNYKVNVTAHQEKAAKNILSKAHRYFENWRGDTSLWKQRTASSTNEIAWSHGSRLVVATAGSDNSERSFSYNAIHLSEAAFFPGWAGVNATLGAKSDWGTVIMESTGNGQAGPFYDTWQNAMYFDDVVRAFDENDEETKAKWNGYYRYFFGWHQESTNRLRLNASERLYIRNTIDSAEQDLIRTLGLDEEQLAWRRQTIKQRCQHQPGMTPEEFFCQEWPSTPDEAFVARGSKFFQPLWLEPEQEIVKRTKPLCRVELVDNLPAVRNEVGSANFTIYEPPQPGHLYCLGVDGAEGLEHGDYSVISVIDRTFARRRRAAMWRSRKLEITSVADIATLIAEWYNMAWICNESSGAFGRALSQRFIDNEYPYLYFDKRFGQVGNNRGATTFSVGFATKGNSRGNLLAGLQFAIRDGLFEIRDPAAIREYKLFEVIDGKAQAPEGENDDIVIADGLALHHATQLGAADPQIVAASPEIRRATEGEVWSAIQRKVQTDERRNKKILGKAWLPRERLAPNE